MTVRINLCILSYIIDDLIKVLFLLQKHYEDSIPLS